MFRTLDKIVSVFGSEKRVILGYCKTSIQYNYFARRFAMKRSDNWPVLEKRVTEDESSAKKPRIKRRTHAILMAYCGQGYLGLQKNKDTKTIEEELLKALLKRSIISQEEYNTPRLANFQRAARTDKGVSALRQVVNLWMREGVTPEEINALLPEEIRVLAVKRVTNRFNSKNSCNARTYSYTCPTFAFANKSVEVSENYRMDDETYERLNKVTKNFLGTHNYFNFTSGRKPFDPSCNRVIISAEWQKPYVTDGLELIIFLVKGQSFMLHQIRKMVGTLMAISRGHLEDDYITKTAFKNKDQVHLPTAPGLGLLLEQIHYDYYHDKHCVHGIHEKIDFHDVESLVDEFRKKHIIPIIIKTEKEDKSMFNYIETLDEHYVSHHPEEAFKEITDNPENVTDIKVETNEEHEPIAENVEEKMVQLKGTNNIDVEVEMKN